MSDRPRLLRRLGAALPPPSVGLPLLLGAALSAAVGALPQGDAPRYETALWVGLLGPAPTGGVAAWCARRSGGGHVDGVLVGLSQGLAVAAVVTAWLTLRGLLGGFCDPPEELAMFFLGGASGLPLAGAFGAAAGLALRFGQRPAPAGLRAVTAPVAGALGPLASATLALLRFHQTPAVFALDPFGGYFAGPLYDTVQGGAVERLVGFRLESAVALLAALVLAAAADRRGRARGTMLLAAAPLLAALAGLEALGPRLGHLTTNETLRAALPGEVSRARCVVRHSPSVGRERAELLADECEVHLDELAAWFDVPAPARVTVWAFADPGEKGRLTGAAHTQVAKPWRREVYVQGVAFPHPILRHELAHVVAGEFGVGPLRVAGPLGGWIPDFGRIEGVAEAAAPRPEARLGGAEWCRAMLDEGLLPPLTAVFQLSFLSDNSRRSYTVAGAFVEWLRAEHGAAAVRDWYGGAPLEDVTGKSLSALEAAWHDSLRATPLDADAWRAVRARFDAPGVLARRCPRVVDARLGELAGAVASGHWERALALADAVSALDPTATYVTEARLRCAVGQARATESLVAPGTPVADVPTDALRLEVLRLGDGDPLRSRELLQGLRDRAATHQEVRWVDLALVALGVAEGGGPPSAEGIAALGLSLAPGAGARQRDAAFAWATVPDAAAGRMLAARHALAEHRFDEASRLAAESLALWDPPGGPVTGWPSLRRGALLTLWLADAARGEAPDPTAEGHREARLALAETRAEAAERRALLAFSLALAERRRASLAAAR